MKVLDKMYHQAIEKRMKISSRVIEFDISDYYSDCNNEIFCFLRRQKQVNAMAACTPLDKGGFRLNSC